MRRGRYKKPTPKQQYRVNERIAAPEVRLIGSDNKQIGVVSRNEALNQARRVQLDLVEIAPRAKPPVAKIIDYRKFQYQESKKTSKQKKSTKKTDLKEVRLKPFMAEGDYQVRLKRIKEFVNDGHQVRLSIPFHGRQLAHKEFGYQLISRIVKDLGELAKVDQQPRFVGRKAIATISKR